MKINSIDTNNYMNKYKVSQVQSTTPYQPSQKSDKVELSSEAQSFAQAIRAAKSAMETQDPQEIEHVRRVTEQINKGTYHVDGVAIAQKMLEGILSKNPNV